MHALTYPRVALVLADDDVRHYQQKGLAQCETDAGSDAAAAAACTPKWKMDKTSEVCKLVLYQSLSHHTMTTGTGDVYDGLGGFYNRDRTGILNFRSQDTKINVYSDDADGVANGHTAQLPGGGLVHYSSTDPVNAAPNRYENHSGAVQSDQLAEIGGPHAHWDYGGRTRAETSVKRTCCPYDGRSEAVKWGDESNPRNYRSGAVLADTHASYAAERRYARHCPPEESWYDDVGPYVKWLQDADGTLLADASGVADGAVICFHNRTVVAEVLMASIDDYDEADPAIADAYTGINNKTTSILYKDKVDDVWDQDKSATSFYQVRATHLTANRTVPT